MVERITEAELREILSPRLPRTGIRRHGTMQWTARTASGSVSVQAAARLVAEVRRLRGLVVAAAGFFSGGPGHCPGCGRVLPDHARECPGGPLLAEARAFRGEHATDSRPDTGSPDDLDR